MKARRLLTAVCLALAITNTTPVYAYSNAELGKLEKEFDDYIAEEIEKEKTKYDSEEDEKLYRYYRIQDLIHRIPTEYYYELIDNIDISSNLKKVLATCIDDEMYDAARESIVYANIAENEQEILRSITRFFESRDNGNANFGGRFKDYYNLEDVNVFDNRGDLIDIPNLNLVFRDYTSYGDYRIYNHYKCASYHDDDEFYLITDKDNKIIAYIKTEDNVYYYEEVEDKEIYMDSLENYLHQVGLDSETKSNYTYEELASIPSQVRKQEMINKGIAAKRKIFQVD